MKSHLKIALLIMTILSTCMVIWAGFTGRVTIFPFLLGLTMFFSVFQLQLDNRNPKVITFYRVAVAVSCLAVVLGALHIIGRI
ncbi:hypothetical protein RYX56_00065 [Alkalihalophilus lindianensis]|uniref:Uncharacterized protein n=1 Tax=Alkalihalophilus lindianensis TaxID=1630542 RepID=A0ABU3X656_9BACI|nr:hypothetical protein [Alkalihalophilus lindianensis]MDV2682758.1 hypothetical protein [Alkalihalophilus lindianensis]